MGKRFIAAGIAHPSHQPWGGGGAMSSITRQKHAMKKRHFNSVGLCSSRGECRRKFHDFWYKKKFFLQIG